MDEPRPAVRRDAGRHRCALLGSACGYGRRGAPATRSSTPACASSLATGWMHNRVRMITASFLVKDLHLPWQWGARHFMDHLVDGDVASNNHGWQWVAGHGHRRRSVPPHLQPDVCRASASIPTGSTPSAGSPSWAPRTTRRRWSITPLSGTRRWLGTSWLWLALASLKCQMLDERKTSILRAVVQEYITTAQPVGSTHIADAPGVRVSSATVRNEMAVLEQEGYLAQPHTSAGRVPTDKGYRFFVDHITTPGRLDTVASAARRDLLRHRPRSSRRAPPPDHRPARAGHAARGGRRRPEGRDGHRSIGADRRPVGACRPRRRRVQQRHDRQPDDRARRRHVGDAPVGGVRSSAEDDDRPSARCCGPPTIVR